MHAGHVAWSCRTRIQILPPADLPLWAPVTSSLQVGTYYVISWILSSPPNSRFCIYIRKRKNNYAIILLSLSRGEPSWVIWAPTHSCLQILFFSVEYHLPQITKTMRWQGQAEFIAHCGRGEPPHRAPGPLSQGEGKAGGWLSRHGLVSGGSFKVEEACLVSIGKNHDKRLIHFQTKVIFKES